MLSNLTIKTKLITLLVISLAILAFSISLFSIVKFKDSLKDQNYATLTAARDSKVNQLNRFLDQKISDIEVLVKSNDVLRMVEELYEAFFSVDIDPEKDFPTEEKIIKKL